MSLENNLSLENSKVSQHLDAGQINNTYQVVVFEIRCKGKYVAYIPGTGSTAYIIETSEKLKIGDCVSVKVKSHGKAILFCELVEKLKKD